MKAWFRSLAAAFGNPSPAQSFAGIALLAIVLYTGYVIPRPSMIGALKWITWINPVRYGFEAILVNEFHTLKATCSSLIPSGDGYEDVSPSQQVCSTPGSAAGQTIVDGNTYAMLSFGYSYSNLWRVSDLQFLLCVIQPPL